MMPHHGGNSEFGGLLRELAALVCLSFLGFFLTL
jgi:hypothetical protein